MNKEYQKLAEIAEKLADDPRYFNNVREWEKSPFGWLKSRPIKKIGNAGEEMVSQFLKKRKFRVCCAQGSSADKTINGKRVEIKFSTLSAKGTYTFNQIRDQKYDILLCFGVSPTDAHGWVVCKNDINGGEFSLKTRKNKRGCYSFGPQHGGRSGDANTWQLALTVSPSAFLKAPSWLRPQGGDLAGMCEVLRKMTSDGGG